jgi:hypothetical protein
VCEDRPDVLDRFARALQSLPDPEMRQVERVQVDSLIHTDGLSGRQFDWVISTASVQRLRNEQIVGYVQNARKLSDYALLFVPNSGNRAHLALSGLRGLSLDETLTLCQGMGARDPVPRRRPQILSAGYCDIPPFPPGLERSSKAKERALHSPLESAAMRVLQWWCHSESWMPHAVQRRLAHLVYVALDMREGER